MTKANKEGRRKAPILRFKGFTDDWEQRELREIAKKRTEKNRPAPSSRRGTQPIR